MITKNADYAHPAPTDEKAEEAPRVDVRSSAGQLQTMDDPYDRVTSQSRAHEKRQAQPA